MSGLRSNFCGLESHKNIGNSILNFEPTGFGHDILTKILVQVNTRFNGQVWAANGPALITNTILQECEATVSSLRLLHYLLIMEILIKSTSYYANFHDGTQAQERTN